MKRITEKQAIELLKKHSSSKKVFEKILNHSLTVKKIALRVANNYSDINLYQIKIGSLLHDIGRFFCFSEKNKIKHGLVGAEILRKEGLLDIALITERHIGVGITREDIIKQKLDLPKKDFLPISKEEKIIAYADNLAFDKKEKTIQDVMKRFKKELGDEYVERILKLKKEIENF